MRTTLRDPGLPHQVVIRSHSSQNMMIAVTCNCREQNGLDPMGLVSDRFDTQRLYNDPQNHVSAWRSIAGVPFGPEYEIHYADVEVSRGQRSKGV